MHVSIKGPFLRWAYVVTLGNSHLNWLRLPDGTAHADHVGGPLKGDTEEMDVGPVSLYKTVLHSPL